VRLAEVGQCVNTRASVAAVIFAPLLNVLRRIERQTLKRHSNADAQRTLMRRMSDGRLRPIISERFEFADAVTALERSKTGHVRGKLVVRVA
jgi:NADPH:quinone reductase-like Zn-dependent oxidoreductase